MTKDKEVEMELERLVRKVMSQREDQDQAVHGDDDGIAQAYVGTEYAHEVLVQISAERKRLRQAGDA